MSNKVQDLIEAWGWMSVPVVGIIIILSAWMAK